MLWLLCAVVLILVFGLSCDGVACCFSCFLGRLGIVVLLSCMSYGLICCSFSGWLRCLCCFHTLYSRFRGRRFFFYCPFLCCSFPDYVAGCCPVLLLLLFAYDVFSYFSYVLLFLFFFSFWFLVGSVFYLFVFLIFGFSLFFFESAIHVDLPAWTGWFSWFF